jgi:hypothetical protein
MNIRGTEIVLDAAARAECKVLARCGRTTTDPWLAVRLAMVLQYPRPSMRSLTAPTGAIAASPPSSPACSSASAPRQTGTCGMVIPRFVRQALSR